jgi:hypothetical protein
MLEPKPASREYGDQADADKEQALGALGREIGTDELHRKGFLENYGNL